MPGFAPQQEYADALIAACPRILSLPNAVAGPPSNPNFPLYWKLSTEYCAWIYCTPQGQYEMSMVATTPRQDESKMRTCDLPSYVRDSRYPEEGLGYVFVVHNHPVGNRLSRRDIRYIVEQGRIHGFSVKTQEAEAPHALGIVAFFSHGEAGSESCAGFFQYTPLTGELSKWSVDAKAVWVRAPAGRVRWIDSENFEVENW